MSFSAVIFDLDGVLADSEPWWNEIDAKLLAQYGVTYRGEYHRNVLGVSYRGAVEYHWLYPTIRPLARFVAIQNRLSDLAIWVLKGKK